jgi:DNA-binding transcriptional LysR family regulator
MRHARPDRCAKAIARTLLAAARASLDVAVLPRFVARRYDDLQVVSAAVATPELYLVTHPEFRRDQKVRATTDFLKRAATGSGWSLVVLAERAQCGLPQR